MGLLFVFDYLDKISGTSYRYVTVAGYIMNRPLYNDPFEEKSKDVTYGDILRWVCELLGAYAVIMPNNNYGELRMIAKGSRETYDSKSFITIQLSHTICKQFCIQ